MGSVVIRIAKLLHQLDTGPYVGALLLLIALIGCMHGRGGQGRGGNGNPSLSSSSFNYRVPPAWGPECERHNPPYRFRAWETDVRLWSTLTDLEPAQQAAAVVMRLSGQARETARTMTPEELDLGGPVPRAWTKA